jgi:hypothetical protein
LRFSLENVSYLSWFLMKNSNSCSKMSRMINVDITSHLPINRLHNLQSSNQLKKDFSFILKKSKPNRFIRTKKKNQFPYPVNDFEIWSSDKMNPLEVDKRSCNIVEVFEISSIMRYEGLQWVQWNEVPEFQTFELPKDITFTGKSSIFNVSN